MCVLCGPGRAQAIIDHTIDHPFTLEPGSDYACSECHQHVSVHPDKMEFLAKHRMDTIIRSGHQIMNIFGGDGPAFSYTVGRVVKDQPELLITGDLPDVVRAGILNVAAERDDLKPGLTNEIIDDFPVKIVEVLDPRKAGMFAALELGDITALQIIWPDAAGRFPGDAGYEYGDEAQPVYGVWA